MGTGNSALFEISSNSTCCKFFTARYLRNTSRSLNSLFSGGGVWRATVPWELLKSISSALWMLCPWSGGFCFRRFSARLDTGHLCEPACRPEPAYVPAPGFTQAVGEVPVLMVLDVNFSFGNFLSFRTFGSQLSFVPIAWGRCDFTEI